MRKKLKERKQLLQQLKELYEEDVDKMLSSEELGKKVGIDDYRYLSSTVEYLERKGLVETQRWLGKGFNAKLSAAGFRTFLDNSMDMSTVMAGAYALLFRLENHLRRFVESKLRGTYGKEWWEKGISQGIQKKVNQMRSDEAKIGWTVAETGNDMEYLMFEHLGGIIVNNWNGVFEPVFKDQSKIHLRLKELEIIRNAIAHTRTLSTDGLARLESYGQDIFNMTR